MMLFIFLIFPFFSASAQKNLKWIEGRDIGVENRLFPKEHREHFYDRLPLKLKEDLKKRVWKLSWHSAGLVLHFTSNSKTLAIKYQTRFNNRMPHMTGVGVRGIDLYVKKNNQWRWAASSKPQEKSWRGTLLSGMQPKTREYKLYLPAYDGIDSLWVGTDRESRLKPFPENMDKPRPVVFYGTSITQGCSASRPGMAPTNQIDRALDAQVINLGFSGNGTLDMAFARFLGRQKLSGLVLDCTPNLPADSIFRKTVRFVEVFRSRSPEVPVILVGNAGHQNRWLVEAHQQTYIEKNRQTEKAYQELRKRGYEHLHFIHGNRLLPGNYEATVDGVHYTDVGFRKYTQTLLPVLKEATAK
jgi:hypothetical protein